MDSLQIQDSFAPYFEARPAPPRRECEDSSETQARPARQADVVERLSRCRDLLARSLSQSQRRA